ncbi:MAG: hypothetical protein VX498_02510 [Myxococcota bacterium]|nr:hypothetical protein [Myxococcota bacterium]
MQQRFKTHLLFGGAGLVGMATCREIARHLNPDRVVVASLTAHEARQAVAELADEFPDIEWVPESGNLFVPTEYAAMARREVLDNPEHRQSLLDQTFGPFEEAYHQNHLVTLILRHKPDAIVDCVNTATGISYQDVFESTALLRDDLERYVSAPDAPVEDFPQDLETGLLSQAMPQIIRHVRFLYRSTVEVGTSVYLKVGTTGTGGMGLNIPYTHSEDRPSKTLLCKNAVAFAHTGLLFLLARTPDAPAVKEIKPAAMIGYRAVEVRQIHGRNGQPKPLYRPMEISISELDQLETSQNPERYSDTGDVLEMTVVNTGENGLFAKGEFGAITALQQMEFVTPEEIAQRIIVEMTGGNTGKDVLAALDGAVMSSSYRAGQLRTVAMKDLQRLEERHSLPSIALGELGPPELSKLLFEAWMLRDACGDSLLGSVHTTDGQAISPEELSERLATDLAESKVAQQAISIGIPILLPDGERFLRGPNIKVPEIKGKTKVAKVAGTEDLDRWARRGWIDLRPSNKKHRQERFVRMDVERTELARKGSAAVSRGTYLPVGLKIGDVVAWVFNNEMGGYRVK